MLHHIEKIMSERGFAALVDADIQKPVLRQRLVTMRQVKILKLSNNLFLQFIREIDVKAWSVNVSH